MGRFAVNLALGVLVLVLALGAARMGLSRGLITLNPGFAAQISPASPDVLQTQAMLRMAQGDLNGARATILASLAREPFSAPSLRILGLIRQASGDTAGARQAMQASGAMSWRDGAAQAWLLQDSLTRGRLAEAVDHADSLLRRSEDLDNNPVLPMMAASVQVLPPMVGPLAQRLSASPPWRLRLLIRLASTPGFETGARAVLMRLRGGPSPPTDPEIAPLISHQVALRQYAQALADWRALSARAQRERGDLRDGDFRLEPDGTPFTWVYQDNAGAIQEQGTAPDLAAGERALTVQYDGTSTPDLALQFVVLPAGPHRLIWRERVEEGDAQPLAWEVRCIGGANALARASPPSGPPRTWASRTLDFIVPPTGCDAQVVRLTAIPGDRRTSIIALYTGMAL